MKEKTIGGKGLSFVGSIRNPKRPLT